MIDQQIQAYYNQGQERDRLTGDGESLELVRTKELLERYLPPPPARVLDVGGGAGVYAAWLARRGYCVHLIDPMPLHVEQASAASRDQPDHPFAVSLGDARMLAVEPASVDAVLLLGPLYHLTERADRVQALREAYRVLRPGGVVVAVGISRMASLLSALTRGALHEPYVAELVERDLREGQHRNPGHEAFWFTTAYFHLPEELVHEVSSAGFAPRPAMGIEGPGAFVGPGWSDPEQRPNVLAAARAAEQGPSIIGLSSHLMVVGRKPDSA